MKTEKTPIRIAQKKFKKSDRLIRLDLSNDEPIDSENLHENIHNPSSNLTINKLTIPFWFTHEKPSSNIEYPTAFYTSQNQLINLSKLNCHVNEINPVIDIISRDNNKLQKKDIPYDIHVLSPERLNLKNNMKNDPYSINNNNNTENLCVNHDSKKAYDISPSYSNIKNVKIYMSMHQKKDFSPQSPPQRESYNLILAERDSNIMKNCDNSMKFNTMMNDKAMDNIQINNKYIKSSFNNEIQQSKTVSAFETEIGIDQINTCKTEFHYLPYNMADNYFTNNCIKLQKSEILTKMENKNDKENNIYRFDDSESKIEVCNLDKSKNIVKNVEGKKIQNSANSINFIRKITAREHKKSGNFTSKKTGMTRNIPYNSEKKLNLIISTNKNNIDKENSIKIKSMTRALINNNQNELIQTRANIGHEVLNHISSYNQLIFDEACSTTSLPRSLHVDKMPIKKISIEFPSKVNSDYIKKYLQDSQIYDQLSLFLDIQSICTLTKVSKIFQLEKYMSITRKRWANLIIKGLNPADQYHYWNHFVNFKDLQTRYALQYSLNVLKPSAFQRDILNDIDRTRIFNGMVAGREKALYNILLALSNSTPKVGYVQGFNTIVSVFLRHILLSDIDIYWLMNYALKKCKLDEIYIEGFPRVKILNYQLEIYIRNYLPEIMDYLGNKQIDISYLSTQWFITIFSYELDFEDITKIWNLYFIKGWKMLIRVALALLHIFKDDILFQSDDDLPCYLKNFVRENTEKLQKYNLFEIAQHFKVTNSLLKTLEILHDHSAPYNVLLIFDQYQKPEWKILINDNESSIGSSSIRHTDVSDFLKINLAKSNNKINKIRNQYFFATPQGLIDNNNSNKRLNGKQHSRIYSREISPIQKILFGGDGTPAMQEKPSMINFKQLNDESVLDSDIKDTMIDKLAYNFELNKSNKEKPTSLLNTLTDFGKKIKGLLRSSRENLKDETKEEIETGEDLKSKSINKKKLLKSAAYNSFRNIVQASVKNQVINNNMYSDRVPKKETKKFNKMIYVGSLADVDDDYDDINDDKKLHLNKFSVEKKGIIKDIKYQIETSPNDSILTPTTKNFISDTTYYFSKNINGSSQTVNLPSYIYHNPKIIDNNIEVDLYKHQNSKNQIKLINHDNELNNKSSLQTTINKMDFSSLIFDYDLNKTKNNEFENGLESIKYPNYEKVNEVDLTLPKKYIQLVNDSPLSKLIKGCNKSISSNTFRDNKQDKKLRSLQFKDIVNPLDNICENDDLIDQKRSPNQDESSYQLFFKAPGRKSTKFCKLPSKIVLNDNEDSNFMGIDDTKVHQIEMIQKSSFIQENEETLILQENYHENRLQPEFISLNTINLKERNHKNYNGNNTTEVPISKTINTMNHHRHIPETITFSASSNLFKLKNALNLMSTPTSPIHKNVNGIWKPYVAHKKSDSYHDKHINSGYLTKREPETMININK